MSTKHIVNLRPVKTILVVAGLYNHHNHISFIAKYSGWKCCPRLTLVIMKPRGSAATGPFWCTSWGACCRRTNPSFLRLRHPVSIKATVTSQPGPCEAMNASFRLENVAVCCGCTTYCLCGLQNQVFMQRHVPCAFSTYEIYRIQMLLSFTVYISHVTAPVVQCRRASAASKWKCFLLWPTVPPLEGLKWISSMWKPLIMRSWMISRLIPPIYSTRLTRGPLYWSV